MGDEKTLMRSDYGYWGFSQPDNGIAQLYVRLRGFGGDELALYAYLYARKWNKDDSGDFKRGSCNMLQETIMADLAWGDRKLKKVRLNLEKYGLLRTKPEKRKHGGYPQTYYWPLEPIYRVDDFLAKYGDELRDGQREILEEVARKQREKAGVVVRDANGGEGGETGAMSLERLKAMGLI